MNAAAIAEAVRSGEGSARAAVQASLAVIAARSKKRSTPGRCWAAIFRPSVAAAASM